MPASRSQNPFSPPPRYTMEAQPAESVLPRGAIDAAGPANENTSGPRRPPNNEAFDRLLRIQQSAATLPHITASPTTQSQSTFGASPTTPPNDVYSLSHLEAGPADIGDAQQRDGNAPVYQGPPAIRPPNATNYIQLVRMATTKKGFFSSLFGTSTSIKDTFCVDPHLNIPGAVLAAVTGDTGEAARRADRRRKNVKLEIENGSMDATIHLVSDNDAISSTRKRAASQLNMRSPRDTAKRQTKLDVKVTTRKSTRFKAYPLKVRLHAPNPRSPFHLVCTTDSPGSPEIPSTASPVTVFLPRNFRGPLRLRITAGNIDRHLTLSRSIQNAAVPLDEDAINRGYFIGSLQQDGELEEEERGNMEDWKGDRVEINVEDGNVRIYYDDEELGWCESMKSNGWMWPREWS